jgi:hypothetical protein
MKVFTSYILFPLLTTITPLALPLSFLLLLIIEKVVHLPFFAKRSSRLYFEVRVVTSEGSPRLTILLSFLLLPPFTMLLTISGGFKKKMICSNTPY